MPRLQLGSSPIVFIPFTTCPKPSTMPRVRSLFIRNRSRTREALRKPHFVILSAAKNPGVLHFEDFVQNDKITPAEVAWSSNTWKCSQFDGLGTVYRHKQGMLLVESRSYRLDSMCAAGYRTRTAA